MQANVEEAILNNVFGTRNVVEAAIENNVERLVLISTDKAVRPANVYGATKRLAEMIVLDAAHRTEREYSVVRFGNVLGSRGSVIPIFKRQIANGRAGQSHTSGYGALLHDHPRSRASCLAGGFDGAGRRSFPARYGTAGSHPRSGRRFEFGLSGLEPGREIEIEFTGIRPGEKLREELWEPEKTYDKTAHPDIFRSEHEDVIANDKLQMTLQRLISLTESGRADEIISLLDEVIPGATIRATPSPEITSVV